MYCYTATGVLSKEGFAFEEAPVLMETIFLLSTHKH